MLEDVRRRRIPLPATGVEIALLDWGGTGPLALLHHANGFCAAVWGPVAQELRRTHRVIALDARGHGDSTAPARKEDYRWELFGADLAAVARVLAAEQPSGRIALGLGHSFGGTACLMAAAAEPGLFERLVLLDPVILPRGGFPSGATPDRGLSLAEQAGKRRAVWPSRAEARARWSEKELFADWDPRALELYLAEGMRDLPDGQVELKCRPEVESMIFEVSRSFDPWPIAAKVATAGLPTLPTRIVRAAKGNFSIAVYRELASVLGDATVTEVEAGHLIPMERPDLALAEVAAALADGAGR